MAIAVNTKQKVRIKEIDIILARIKHINATKPLLRAVEIKREMNMLMSENPNTDTSTLLKQYNDYLKEYAEGKEYKKSFIDRLLNEYHELTGILYRYETFIKQ